MRENTSFKTCSTEKANPMGTNAILPNVPHKVASGRIRQGGTVKKFVNTWLILKDEIEIHLR